MNTRIPRNPMDKNEDGLNPQKKLESLKEIINREAHSLVPKLLAIMDKKKKEESEKAHV